MKIKSYLLFVALALLPSFAWAANTSISNGETGGVGIPPAAGVRGKLNINLGQQYNVRQYGAVGDGVTNDYTAINNAQTDACAANGGIIYFPPGTYLVSQSLVPCQKGGTALGLTYMGAGRYNSMIICNLTGYCVDHPDVTNTDKGLLSISHIGVTNTRFDPDAGAIRLAFTFPGIHITDCYINGWSGIEVQSDMFAGSISDCEIIGPNAYAPNSVGVAISQMSLRDVRLDLYGTAVAVGAYESFASIAGSPPAVLLGVSVEQSGTGVYAGGVKGSTVTATVSGTSMVVSNFVDGPPFTVGDQIFGYSFALPANTTIAACPGGNCAATGTYTLNQSGGSLASQTIYTGLKNSTAVGLVVEGFQTEAVNTHLALWSTSFSKFSALALTSSSHGSTQSTGSGGSPVTVGWTAAAGGTLTYTAPFSFGISGVAQCSSDSWTNSGIPVAALTFNNASCTYTGNTVTRTGFANPGPAIGGFIGPNMNACVLAANVSNITLEAITCSSSNTPRDTGFDFTWGSQNQTSITLIGTASGPGVLYSNTNKASFQAINSPGMSPTMRFFDLPGQVAAGTVNQPLQEGMEYIITDAQDVNCGSGVAGQCSVWGVTVTGGSGGAGLHRKLRYNGTNWTIVGQ